MTCIVSTDSYQLAVVCADTLVCQQRWESSGADSDMRQVARFQRSKITEIAGPVRGFFANAGTEEGGRDIRAAILDDKKASDLPPVLDGCVKRLGLGDSFDEASLTSQQRRLLGAPVHLLGLDDEGAIRAFKVDPVAGTREAADGGIWVSLPLKAKPTDCVRNIQMLARDLGAARRQHAGTLQSLAEELRSFARFFAGMAGQYGGDDGFMNDQIEVAAIYRVPSGRVVSLHRDPVRAVELMGAPDETVLQPLVDAGGRSVRELFTESLSEPPIGADDLAIDQVYGDPE